VVNKDDYYVSTGTKGVKTDQITPELQSKTIVSAGTVFMAYKDDYRSAHLLT